MAEKPEPDDQKSAEEKPEREHPSEQEHEGEQSEAVRDDMVEEDRFQGTDN